MPKKYNVVPRDHVKDVDSKEGKKLVQMLIEYKKQKQKGTKHLQGFQKAIADFQQEHNIELAGPISMHF